MSRHFVTAGYPYPTPDRAPENYAAAYDEAREKWARGLSEMTLRSFAADYMQGARTDEAIDGYAEYKRREGLGLLSHQKSQEMTQRARKKRSSNQSRK